MTASQTCSTVTTDSVDLVNKDDAGGIFLALLEQVTNTRSTYTDEHFHEVGTRDRKERNVGFTRNRLGEQGLSSSGRAHHKDALRDLSAELLKLLRIFQEFDDLL